MTNQQSHASPFFIRALLGAIALSAAALGAALPAWAAPGYTPITPTMSDRTVTLNGHNLTIDQIVMVARYGAKVELSADARQQEAENYGLLLEAAAEGIPVYWFNRGAGDQRETVMFEGDPMTPKNHALIEKSQAQIFHSGALWGTGPEIGNEEIVRAMMVVRANAMV
ncbi:MAG TPA: aromatic amino acid lyase, partial [Steroidobacteraceae bacterium]|nr:aromatic amino acid lyase [Steroidobacteraceae bacterium]